MTSLSRRLTTTMVFDDDDDEDSERNWHCHCQWHWQFNWQTLCEKNSLKKSFVGRASTLNAGKSRLISSKYLPDDNSLMNED
jgi:hypothetical protein